MDVDKFFSKNPRVWLANTTFSTFALGAALWGSFAVERPSILILISVMLAMQLMYVLMIYHGMLTKDTTIYVFLDKEGVLVNSVNAPNELAIKEHHPIYSCWHEFTLSRHILRVERLWYGYRVTATGPASKNYTIQFLGMRRWYGYGIRFKHAANKEIILIRDWNNLQDLFEYALRVLDGADHRGIYNLVGNAFEHRSNKLAKELRDVKKKPAEKQAEN